MPHRPKTKTTPPRQAAGARGSGDSELRSMCERVLSQWADRRGVALDTSDIAQLFSDEDPTDSRRIDEALQRVWQYREEAKRSPSAPRTASAAHKASEGDAHAILNAKSLAAHTSATARGILQAAQSTFLANGYEVSLDEIARVAGVSKPTIYSHFGDKDRLFRAAMVALAEEMAPRIDAPDISGDLREELVRYAHAFRKITMLDRNLLAFRLALLSLPAMPDIGALMDRNSIQRARTAMTAFFSSAMDAGLIRTLDPELLSEHFFGAAAGQARTRRLMGLEPEPPEREDAYVEQMVDCFLLGVSATGKTAKARHRPSRGARSRE